MPDNVVNDDYRRALLLASGDVARRVYLPLASASDTINHLIKHVND